MIEGSEPLTFPRHEAFALALAKGIPYDDAYVAAGYRHHQSNASRLSRNELVCSRVKYLKYRAEKRHLYTVDDLIQMAEDARVRSIEAVQMGAAVAAIREIGILTGHRVERREQRITHEHELSDAELLEIVRQARRPSLELRTNGADQVASDDGVDAGVEQNGGWTKRDITRR